tara:strand:- start:200 stop:355 length:156 start_codon:yes stop_codon:yes gene_type:complete
MIPFLIATSLTCPEAHELVQKMREYEIDDKARTEMIQIVKEDAVGCWDAND